MAAWFSYASLIPPGLMVSSVNDGENTLAVTACSRAVEASCPVGGVASHCVQSRYIHSPSDLP